MEPLKVTPKLKGPGYIIIPLSESEYDRWMFNDVVDFEREGMPVADDVELKRIYDITIRMQELIKSSDAAIKPTRANMRRYHEKLYARYKSTL